MVYIALCALILGIIFGQFVLDSTWHDLCSELADYVLYLLMFSVGISVGMNESIIEKIKNYNLTILLIPIGVIIGSVFGGFICSYIFDMNLVYSLSIGASMGYDNLVISIKSSDVLMCVKAHELITSRTDHPLHVGITEAGTLFSGNIKSAVGLGIILYQGIGDTIRVSLTGDPIEEIKSARQILKTLGLRKGGVEVVSCPTCGRTRIDLIHLANQVETMVSGMEGLDGVKVAVMGCVVNGPGEAREADIGIAGGVGEGLIIKKGEILRKVPEEDLLDSLRSELEAMAEARKK